MVEKTVEIKNKTGLHARPAARFVQAAGKFSSRITIRRAGDEEPGDAKNIISLLGLGLSQGDLAEIAAEGADEEEAVRTLTELIESGFGE